MQASAASRSGTGERTMSAMPGFIRGDLVYVKPTFAEPRGHPAEQWVGRAGLVVESYQYKYSSASLFYYIVLIDGLQFQLDEFEITAYAGGF